MMNSKRQYLLANGQGVLGQLGVFFSPIFFVSLDKLWTTYHRHAYVVL